VSFDSIWAGWRSSYLESITDGPPGAGEATEIVRPPPPGDGSLFERILTIAGDAESGVEEGTLVPLDQDSEGFDLSPQSGRG